MIVAMLNGREAKFVKGEFCSVAVNLISALSPEIVLRHGRTLICRSVLNQKAFLENSLKTGLPWKYKYPLDPTISKGSAQRWARDAFKIDCCNILRKRQLEVWKHFNFLKYAVSAPPWVVGAWITYFHRFLIDKTSCTLTLWLPLFMDEVSGGTNHHARHRLQAERMSFSTQICHIQMLFHKRLGPCSRLQLSSQISMNHFCANEERSTSSKCKTIFEKADGSHESSHCLEWIRKNECDSIFNVFTPPHGGLGWSHKSRPAIERANFLVSLSVHFGNLRLFPCSRYGIDRTAAAVFLKADYHISSSVLGVSRIEQQRILLSLWTLLIRNQITQGTENLPLYLNHILCVIWSV